MRKRETEERARQEIQRDGEKERYKKKRETREKERDLGVREGHT